MCKPLRHCFVSCNSTRQVLFEAIELQRTVPHGYHYAHEVQASWPEEQASKTLAVTLRNTVLAAYLVTCYYGFRRQPNRQQ